MAEADAPVSEIGDTLKKKVGPLPVWAWGLGGGLVVGLGIKYFRNRGQSFGTTEDGTAYVGGEGTGFEPGDRLPNNASGYIADPHIKEPSNNEEWWRVAVEALVGDGVTPTKAHEELTKFLEGGVAGPDTRALADRAIRLVGAPPFPPPPLQDPPMTTPPPPPPPPPPPGDVAPLQEWLHITIAGDTLTGLAQWYFGHAQDWGAIYSRNKAVIDAIPGNSPDWSGTHNLVPGTPVAIPVRGNVTNSPIILRRF